MAGVEVDLPDCAGGSEQGSEFPPRRICRATHKRRVGRVVDGLRGSLLKGTRVILFGWLLVSIQTKNAPQNTLWQMW